jgi:hypothetical protein
MEDNPDKENEKKEVMKETKEYASISTRLSKLDALKFILHCKRLETNSSERIRDLVLKDMKNPQRQVMAGKNLIKYDKLTNSFSWVVQLDSGKETEVLKNLSDDFLKNLKAGIDEAIIERNTWIHQSKSDSIDIPADVLGRKDE